MYRHLKKLLTGVLSLTVLCAAAMPSMALDGTGNVASVDGQEYATVQEAINNGNGKTVTLLDDAKENVVIPEGATVTLSWVPSRWRITERATPLPTRAP